MSVQCGFTEVVWRSTTDAGTPGDDVHIWKLWLPAALSHIGAAASLLNADELERAGRYLHERNKHRFTLSRAMLRCLLAKYTSTRPMAIQFSTTGNKKPCIAGSDLQFNVSHSGDVVLIAIANEPVGIDVELVDDGFDFSDVLPISFSRDEAALVDQFGRESFYRYWTRKESLAKASGNGLDSNMQSLPAIDGTQHLNAGIIESTGSWVVNSFDAAVGYMSSLAYEASEKNVHGYDVSSVFAELLGV